MSVFQETFVMYFWKKNWESITHLHFGENSAPNVLCKLIELS